MFWTLAPSFLNPYILFLDLAQGGWNLDIETRCMQEVVVRGKFGYWNNKNIRSGGEAKGESLRMKRNGCRKLRGTEGKGKFDIETGWAQKVVERWGAKPRHWNDISEDTWRYMQKNCWETRRGFFGPKNECRKLLRGTGSGEFRYWDKMHARRCWEKRGNMQLLKPGDRRKLVRERQVGEGKARHRNKDERKKLLRREAEV